MVCYVLAVHLINTVDSYAYVFTPCTTFYVWSMKLTSTQNLHFRAWIYKDFYKRFYQLYPPCSLVIYPVIYNVQPHVDIFIKYTVHAVDATITSKYNKHTTGCSICLQRHSNLWCQKFSCHLLQDKVFWVYIFVSMSYLLHSCMHSLTWSCQLFLIPLTILWIPGHSCCFISHGINHPLFVSWFKPFLRVTVNN